MTTTYTTTATESFTITHARELASRVIADMKLCYRYYGAPQLERLDMYSEELVMLLKNDYLDTYEFGFKANGKRVVSCFYRVSPCGDLEGGSPGGVPPRADVSGATHFNFMTYSTRWFNEDTHLKIKFEESLPLQRSDGTAPIDGNGYWLDNDRGYAAGGCLLTRRTYRPN